MLLREEILKRDPDIRKVLSEVRDAGRIPVEGGALRVVGLGIILVEEFVVVEPNTLRGPPEIPHQLGKLWTLYEELLEGLERPPEPSGFIGNRIPEPRRALPRVRKDLIEESPT